MIKPTNGRTAIFPKTFNPQLSDQDGDAAEIFDIDRSDVVIQLRTLRRAIEEGALDMEMVAAERVFGKSLSRTLVRRARRLHLIAKDMNGLLHLVERAHVEKPLGRPATKSELSLPSRPEMWNANRSRAERIKAVATGRRVEPESHRRAVSG
jgi:hypothetical protein